MLNYDQLEALATVIETKSFERAAEELHLSQSAISQRIKALEESFGQPLVIRTTPPTLTEMGQVLLRHFIQVKELEVEALAEVEHSSELHWPELSIALNNDSIESWFLEAMIPHVKEQEIILKLFVDDETLTHEFLRAGTVYGSITTLQNPPPGCNSVALGALRYRLVATKEFKKKYFGSGISKKSLKEAPGLVFNDKEVLLFEYLKKNFRLEKEEVVVHYVPSSHGFLKYTLGGLCYALIPEPDLKEALQEGSLVDLTPQKTFDVHYYWHAWHLQTNKMEAFSRALCREAAKFLQA